MGISDYNSVGLQSDIHSASPHRLIQMLFEGAILKINQAKGDIERKSFDSKSKRISEVIAILNELEASLNRDKSPELVENLADLYTYMRLGLFEANAKNDLAKLDEISTLILELKEAWDQIPVEMRDMSGGRVLPELDSSSEPTE